MVKVSVIVPFYNCPYIQEALESILNQTYHDIEIVVVNDGSTKYHEKIIPYMNKIKYIEKENGGTATALNEGIRAAEGEYFCWLSSDDKFANDKIEKQLIFMEQNNAKASYTGCYAMKGNKTVEIDYFNDRYANRREFLKALRKSCIINGCTVMIRMDVFSNLGLFDESFKFTHDYEFWMRTAEQFEFHNLPERLVFYRVHDGMGTYKYKKEVAAEVNRLRRKYYFSYQKLIMKLG